MRLSKLGNTKILLVDDDVHARTIIKEALIDKGGLVAEAASSEEAIKQIENYRFDIVISDSRELNKSGVEILNFIRSYRGEAPRLIRTNSFMDVADEQEKSEGKEGLHLKARAINDLLELIADD